MTLTQLPHTGMWVPTTRLTVTAVHESSEEDVARVATVHYDQTLLGYTLQARRRYVLRLIGDHALPLHAEAVAISGPYPRYETARRELSQREFASEVARAELWVGQRWTPVHPNPEPTP